jgi:hypothetical protein
MTKDIEYPFPGNLLGSKVYLMIIAEYNRVYGYKIRPLAEVVTASARLNWGYQKINLIARSNLHRYPQSHQRFWKKILDRSQTTYI